MPCPLASILVKARRFYARTIHESAQDRNEGGDKRRVDTIRMIAAALKDKDIEARGQGKDCLGLKRFCRCCKNGEEPARVL